MPNYRFYPLDPSGQISGPYSAAVCDDDRGAVLWAEEMSRASGVEVWQGARLVRRLTAVVRETGSS
jgi:hypothetical protein